MEKSGELGFFHSDADLPELVQTILARTPARLLRGRVGTGYRTDTLIELRDAHAAARDAVRTEIDMRRDLGSTLVEELKLFEVCTQAKTKDDYLVRPDLGRHFSGEARQEILRRCPLQTALQLAIGDGLSVAAVREQVPKLMKLLWEGAKARGWSIGQPFLVRHCRVGILNEIGDVLAPRVAILLIGERPGLATADSLSAYMAYQPGRNHTDADRNLISNIHARGLTTQHAAGRILELSAQMVVRQKSGFTLREQATVLCDGEREPEN